MNRICNLYRIIHRELMNWQDMNYCCGVDVKLRSLKTILFLEICWGCKRTVWCFTENVQKDGESL